MILTPSNKAAENFIRQSIDFTPIYAETLEELMDTATMYNRILKKIRLRSFFDTQTEREVFAIEGKNRKNQWGSLVWRNRALVFFDNSLALKCLQFLRNRLILGGN